MPGGQISASGGGFNRHVDPGDVNPPAIFEPATSLTISGSPEVWVAASGGANWGGCIVSISFDGTTYSQIGIISSRAFQGTLTASLPNHADPDTVDTLALDLAESVGLLPTSATHADADALRTLVWLCHAFTTTAPAIGELISYGAVAATGTYTSNLTYLRRGLYGTAPAAHASGDFFTRIDLGEIGGALNTIIVYQLPPQYIGASFDLKFQSFNVFGNETQDISAVAAYSYTPSGSGYGGGAGGVPTTPTGLAAYARGGTGAGFNIIDWNANPPGDHVQHYTVLRRVSGVGSYNPIGTSTTTSYVDNTAVSGTQYDCELVAVNSVGPSVAAGPVTVTTN
jgi:hypothetical protein